MQPQLLIIGLGNPGQEYANTRHNAGFIVADEIAREMGEKFTEERKFNAFAAAGTWAGNTIVVGKPLTFMNNSGDGVIRLSRYYKISSENIIVIHDEIDLPFGTIRASEDSGSAGHKGVESVINALGTKSFRRIRIGVNSSDSRGQLPTEEYVLKNFSAAEQKTLEEEIIPQALKKLRALLHANGK